MYFFLDAVGADLAPFIMVAAEPDLGDIVKFAVFIDFLRVDVAVVVDDRHLLRIFVVQPSRGLRGKQKIFIYK